MIDKFKFKLLILNNNIFNIKIKKKYNNKKAKKKITKINLIEKFLLIIRIYKHKKDNLLLFQWFKK